MTRYAIIQNGNVVIDYDSYDEAVSASQYDANDSGETMEIYELVTTIEPEESSQSERNGVEAGVDYPLSLCGS